MMIKRYLRYYWMLIKLNAKLDITYSVNFWISFLTDFTIYMIQILTFSALFINVDTINGWTIYHMILFLGTFTIIDSLCMMTYFFGLIYIPADIRSGDLDKYIIKPINTLFYMATRDFKFSNILNVIIGIAIVCYAAAHLVVKITLFKIIGYILLVLIMYMLMFGIMLLIRTAAFWFINVDALMELEDQLMNFAFKVPGVVFKGFYKILFFTILPYGLIATVPTQFFTDNLSVGSVIGACSITVIFFLLSIKAWNCGIKHYSSASS